MALTLAGNLQGTTLPGAGEHAAPALPHPATHFWTPASLARLAAQQQHLSQQQQLPLPHQQQQQQAPQLLNTSQQLPSAATQQQLPQPMPLQQCFLPDANIMPQRQPAPLKLQTINPVPLPTAAPTQAPHTTPSLPQQQPATPAATTTTQPCPKFKLPLLDENKVAVLCNSNPGVYLLDRLSILCSCVSCGRPTEMTPTEFERHSGMAASKKWRRSIKVDYTDDPNMTIGRWLEVNGYDNNKVKLPGGAEAAAAGCGASKPLAGPAGGSRPGSHSSSSSSSSHLHHHSSHHHAREHLPKSNLGRQPMAAAAAAVVDRIDDVSKDEVADILLFLKSGRSAEPMDEDDEEEGAAEEEQQEAGGSYGQGSQRQQQSSQQCSDDTLGPQADQRQQQQQQQREGEVLQEQASGDQDDSSKRANRSRRAPSWLADTVDPERPDILPDQHHHLQQAHTAAVVAAAAAAAKQRGASGSLPAMARVLEAVKASQAAAAAGLQGAAGPCSSGSLKRRREEDRGAAGLAHLAEAESREVSESMGNGDVAKRPLITTSQVTLPAGAAGVVVQQAVAAQQARAPGRVVASGAGVAGPRVAQWRLLPGQERLLLTVKLGGATFSGVIGALEVDV